MGGKNIGTLFSDNAIDVQSVDTDDIALDVDAATDVAAKFFNDLPLRVSFARAAHIESEANMAQRLEGAENFTNAAMVRNQLGPNRSDDEENDETAVKAFVRSSLDELKRTQDREREEWSRTTSAVGNVSMTGGEWAALSQLMQSDEDFRRKVLDAFMARGMTRDKAKAHYDVVTDMATIAAKPPAERTEAESERFEQGKANPVVQQDMDQVNDLANLRTAEPSLNGTFNQSAVISPTPDTATSGVAPSSVERRSTAVAGFGL